MNKQKVALLILALYTGKIYALTCQPCEALKLKLYTDDAYLIKETAQGGKNNKKRSLQSESERLLNLKNKKDTPPSNKDALKDSYSYAPKRDKILGATTFSEKRPFEVAKQNILRRLPPYQFPK